ncbi:MAG: pentapeptide repeat-containing protein [Planctomycetaceae bacterium]|nr:pentapeptide repeat-containing protein [Planctomycetaceae bacterium]
MLRLPNSRCNLNHCNLNHCNLNRCNLSRILSMNSGN